MALPVGNGRHASSCGADVVWMLVRECSKKLQGMEEFATNPQQSPANDPRVGTLPL
jgi:hypothetical protein